jgi:3-dehydroquinate dehydratase/shikimate dehydrogenase
MSKLCICLTARTISENLAALEKYRGIADLAELRVDFLDPDERFFIRKFPELAGLPVVLTVRRAKDGGKFLEGEGSRLVLLANGLSFADQDPRKNYAYIDLEEDLHSPALEEAARTFGTKIIRSIHDFSGVPSDLPRRLEALRHHPDEIPLVGVTPHGMKDVLQLYRLASRASTGEKIIFGMGQYGTCTRILCRRFGSAFTYASPEGSSLAGPGQLDPRVLELTYRYRSIEDSTCIFGIVGDPDASARSPFVLNPAFARAGLDAVIVPFMTDRLEDFLEFAREFGMEGFGVAYPFKQAILSRLDELSPEVKQIGACNTVVRSGDGWKGYNTDASGFEEAVLAFLGRRNLSRVKTTLIGAGGAAYSVAYRLKKLGAKVCVLNRTPIKAKILAERFRFSWSGLDVRGLELLDRHRDLIIQATSAGMENAPPADPIEFYRFTGSEIVFDLVCRKGDSPILARAKAAGCRTTNGLAMLQKQAEDQFRVLTGMNYVPG